MQNKESYTFNPISTAFLAFTHIAAIGAFLPENFSWSAVWLCMFLYWLTASVGVCFGFHRLLSHRAFKIPLALELFVVCCGALACEGTPRKWIAHHRLHHRFSDTQKDPHNASQGFWWAHIGWMCFNHKDADNPVKIKELAYDICTGTFFRPFNNFLFIIWMQIAIGLILFLIGGWPWVFWGVFLRLVIVWHATWLVNSAAHYFGYKTYDLPEPDRSTNCWWVGLLAWGEGWHNNHHKCPSSARHGWKWFEIDMTWWFIRFLEIAGIATQVKAVRPS
ncbi:MAG: fatty acid desaturase [Parcubacteria group bacterium]|nr:fatty acid desaturase [Parcubacteria group bacterium]